MRRDGLLVVACALALVLAAVRSPAVAWGAATGVTTRVSVSSSGAQANAETQDCSISDDGRFVAFCSLASNLVLGDTNGASDIFVHDRMTGTTTRVSVDSAGVQTDYDSIYFAISGNGRFVVFDSAATNLVPGDTNGRVDIFVHDRATGATTLESVSSAGVQGNDRCGDIRSGPAISDDGRFVAFSSRASNLVPDDTNATSDIFVRDRVAGTTTRVSVDSAGNQCESWRCLRPSISNDGSVVAFDSVASNLVPADTNSTMDVFVHDSTTGVTSRVSVDSSGAQALDGSEGSSVSDDGRYVAFSSGASNLVPDDTNGETDAFVHDRSTGETVRVSANSSGGVFPHLSGSGRFVAFASSGASIYDRVTGLLTAGPHGVSAISDDGRFVAFESAASDLVAGDTNGVSDAFLYDRSGSILGDYDSRLGLPAVLLLNGLHHKGGEGEMGGLQRALAEHEGSVVATVAIITSLAGASEPGSGGGDAIDLNGHLDVQVDRLTTWLVNHADEYGSSPIIIVGHSYGGVIARGLVSERNADSLEAVGLGDRVIGVIQLGSPNEGSEIAATLNAPDSVERKVMDWGFYASKATFSLSPDVMSVWNLRNERASVPVHRIAGHLLPGALDDSSGPARYLKPEGCREVLWWLHRELGKAPSDGIVPVESVRGEGAWFGGGECDTQEYAKHGNQVPVTGLWKSGWLRSSLVREYRSVVPATQDDPTLQKVISRINNIRDQSGGQDSPGGPAYAGVGVQGEAVGSHRLPGRLLDVVGSGAHGPVALDGAPTSMLLSSGVAAPEVSVVGSEGPLGVASTSWREAGGMWHTAADVPTCAAGQYDLRVSLGGAEGTVTVAAVSSGGPGLRVSGDNETRCAGRSAVFYAAIVDDAIPAADATVTGELANGEHRVPLAYRDDGVEPDEAAGDEVYSAAATLAGEPGDWAVVAQAVSEAFEREDVSAFSVGSADWAAFVGAATETRTAGPAGTIASIGISVSVAASAPGTYSVSCDLLDASGKLLAQSSSPATVLSAETTSMSIRVPGERVAQMSDGALTFQSIELARHTEDGVLSCDRAPSLETSTLSAGDFLDFSVVATPLFSHPTSSTTPTYVGQARYTPGAVASVDYSFDGGSVWTSATASDGAFDSAEETFTIDLDLPDGLYGVLVRSVTSGGIELPREQWSADRFIVDSAAPAGITDLEAVPDLFDWSTLHMTWSAVESMTTEAALVRYEIVLDGSPIGSTYDTSFDLSLPNEFEHDLWVVPVDEAGNTGTLAALTVGQDQVAELAGGTRYDTAISISRATYTTGSCDAVILATGRNFPDALGAGSLAGVRDCPILLVDGTAKSLPASVRGEIQRLTQGRSAFDVYLMGGRLALSNELESSLRSQLSSESVYRVAGGTRYDTAIACATEVRQRSGSARTDAFLVTGRDFADALLAGPVAFAYDRPIFLTDNSTVVNDKVKTALTYSGTTDVAVIGSTANVTEATRLAMDGHVPGTCSRVASATSCYQQSVNVANWATGAGLLDWTAIGVATGEKYPDALAASSYLGSAGTPLLLTHIDTLDTPVKNAVTANKTSIGAVTYFGGILAVTQAVRDQIEGALE